MLEGHCASCSQARATALPGSHPGSPGPPLVQGRGGGWDGASLLKMLSDQEQALDFTCFTVFMDCQPLKEAVFAVLACPLHRV